MDDAGRVRGLERIGDLHADINGGARTKRARIEPFPERRALQELHGDERSSVLLANVVHGADVRMVERRCAAGFTLKAAQRVGIASQFRRDEFEGDRSMQPSILSFETTPMPPPPSFSPMR